MVQRSAYARQPGRIRKRRLASLALSLFIALVICGCTAPYPFDTSYWVVHTRLLTSTGPIANAIVQMRPLHHGQVYGAPVFERYANDTGNLRYLMLPRDYPAGSSPGSPLDALEPIPTAIEVLVRTAEAEGRVTVPISPDNISGYESENGVTVGNITIAEIAVELHALPSVGMVSVPSGADLIVAADTDGDEDTDILVSALGPSQISILHNDSTGTLTSTMASLSPRQPNLQIYALHAGDVDRDNDADIVLIGLLDGDDTKVPALTVLHNSAEVFTLGPASIPAVSMGPYVQVQLSDYDADADLDFLLGRTAFFNNGAGRFSPQTPVDYGMLGLLSADLDGDGRLDRVTTDTVDAMRSTVLRVAFADSSGAIGVPQEYVIPGRAGAATTADVDEDIDLDVILITESYDPDYITKRQLGIVKNNGDGTLGNLVEFPLHSMVGFLDAHDWDQDGDVDVATWSTSPAFNVIVHLNDGQGGFMNYAFVSLAPQGNVRGHELEGVVVVDLDGNEIADLVGLHTDGSRANAVVLLNPFPQ